MSPRAATCGGEKAPECLFTHEAFSGRWGLSSPDRDIAGLLTRLVLLFVYGSPRALPTCPAAPLPRGCSSLRWQNDWWVLPSALCLKQDGTWRRSFRSLGMVMVMGYGAWGGAVRTSAFCRGAVKGEARETEIVVGELRRE